MRVFLCILLLLLLLDLLDSILCLHATRYLSTHSSPNVSHFEEQRTNKQKTSRVVSFVSFYKHALTHSVLMFHVSIYLYIYHTPFRFCFKGYFLLFSKNKQNKTHVESPMFARSRKFEIKMNSFKKKSRKLKNGT